MTSFKEAFTAARKDKGAGGTFTWNGKKYTTDRADDKKATPGSKAPPRRPTTKGPSVMSEAPTMGKSDTASQRLKTSSSSSSAPSTSPRPKPRTSVTSNIKAPPGPAASPKPKTRVMMPRAGKAGARMTPAQLAAARRR